MNSDTNAPVHDAAQVGQLLGIEYTAEQLAAFGSPPEPLAGFVTFFDPGWSILRLRDAVAGKGTIFCPQTWYDTQPFAQREDWPRYCQFRIEAVKDSFTKTFTEQQQLLAEDEEIPAARAVIMGVAMHFLGSGTRLFPACYVRCADTTADSYRVVVGGFGSGGLGVEDGWVDGRDVRVGVAVARKVP